MKIGRIVLQQKHNCFPEREMAKKNIMIDGMNEENKESYSSTYRGNHTDNRVYGHQNKRAYNITCEKDGKSKIIKYSY